MDEKLKFKISVGHNNQNIFSNLGFRCDRKQEAIYGVEKMFIFLLYFFSTEDVYDWNGHFILNLGIAHSCQFWGLVSFFHNLFFSILFERTKVANKARKVFWKRRKRVFISNPSFSRKHSFLFWTNARKNKFCSDMFLSLVAEREWKNEWVSKLLQQRKIIDYDRKETKFGRPGFGNQNKISYRLICSRSYLYTLRSRTGLLSPSGCMLPFESSR